MMAALLNSKTYERTCEDLLDKYGQDSRVLNSSPLYEGLELRQMLLHQEEVIQVLIEQIKNQSFEFSPQKKVIFRQGSKSRKIYISPWPDRILLMTLARLLQEKMEPKFHHRLYSFRKGWNKLQAQKELSSFIKTYPECYVLKRDVNKYGDSIDQEVLLQKLSTLELETSVLSLLKKAISPDIIDDEGVVSEKLTQGIPSGSPLVPVFENFYLLEMDHKLLTLENSFYARYGDDFVFLSPEKEIADKAQRIIEEELAKINLSVSEKKKINLKLSSHTHETNAEYPVHEHFDWLGTSFLWHGRTSIKVIDKGELTSFLRKEIKKAFTHAHEWNLPLDDKKILLSNALKEVFSLKDNPQLEKMVLHKTDDEIVKKLDHDMKFFIVKQMMRVWRLKGKEAWKLLRELDIPSLNYQRRNYLSKVL